MKTSNAGRQLIKMFEGLRLKAYKDPVGIWTIGYGHTGDVEAGMKITLHQADLLLQHDLEHFEEGVVRLAGTDLNQYQFDALVSFSYNVGLGNLRRSTLLEKIHEGDMAAAAEEFLRWNKAGGKVLRGLTRRRKAEREMFLTKTWF